MTTRAAGPPKRLTGRSEPEPGVEVGDDEVIRRATFAEAINTLWWEWAGRDHDHDHLPETAQAGILDHEARYAQARQDEARACIARGADPEGWRPLYGSEVDRWAAEAALAREVDSIEGDQEPEAAAPSEPEPRFIDNRAQMRQAVG